MPWNEKNYPVSMKNLSLPVRRKAIEIANALLEEGYAEGRAIAIATSRAEKWGQSRKAGTSTKKTTKKKTVKAKPKK